MKSDRNKPPCKSSHSYSYKNKIWTKKLPQKDLKMPWKGIPQAREMGVEKVVDYVEQYIVSFRGKVSKSSSL